MSTLDDLNAGPGGIAGFVSSLSRRLRPVSRRDLFVGAAVAGSALATSPKNYVLRPQPAYATICGPGNTASSGWTVFCCTVNKGVNACPPGSFAAGWWKAADSSWCGAGYRYIVDCNASCSKCSTGCTDGICDSKCWSCSCGTGSSATCDQRRVCCNAFRYGQCNTQVKCSGGVHCRVVSCVAPYKWASCTTTSLVDDRTAEHSAPCLPGWGAISQKERDMGAQGSYLKASTTPGVLVGDGRGTYVVYQGGSIYYTKTTGAHGVPNSVKSVWASVDGPRGLLGYPNSDWLTGRVNGGWIQTYEHGAITDSPDTTTKIVYGTAYTQWTGTGRESGLLGYPTTNRISGMTDTGWRQEFQRGVVIDSASTSTKTIYGEAFTAWKGTGRETGVLGYPTTNRISGMTNGGWRQEFERGIVIDSANTPTKCVYGDAFTSWVAGGRETGDLGYPVGNRVSGQVRGGWRQAFERGELWALTTPYRVLGPVLTEWQAQGGAAGSYGYPITDTTTVDGKLTCTFEGGTITA